MNVAIILAAGESRRLGEPKQLLPFAGKTMLERVIDAFTTPKVDEILVVLGYRAGAIARHLGRARRVDNPDYKDGMFTSVQAGLRALPAGTKLVLLGLCDQPRLQRATVEELVGRFSGKILIPTFNGRQGHPLMFEARYAKEILTLGEGLTLKHFLANHPDEITRSPVDDDGVIIDIDDRASYERELQRDT